MKIYLVCFFVGLRSDKIRVHVDGFVKRSGLRHGAVVLRLVQV